jgi:membrane protease YdiL (CAAX protease family)
MNESSQLSDASDSAHDKKIALWEIASVITSCLIAEWVALSFAGRNKIITLIPVLLALGLIFLSHRERGETLHYLGFRTDNFLAACRLLLLPTVVVVLFVAGADWLGNHSLTLPPWRNRFLLLPLWALFQQYVLNGFINRRAQLGLGKGLGSVVLVGAIFALLHLPNPLLAILTFVGGFVWAWAYQRQPNLFALAISHAVSSIALALTISPKYLDSLRVGFKYFG